MLEMYLETQIRNADQRNCADISRQQNREESDFRDEKHRRHH